MKSLRVIFPALLFLTHGFSFVAAQDTGTLLNPEVTYSMPSGAQFNVPKGWLVQPKNGQFILKDPDGKMTLVLSESQEGDGLDVINDARKSYSPDVSLAVAHKQHNLKLDDWDEEYRVWYFVPSDENPRKASETRGFYAISKKRNNRWYVGLLDYDRVSAAKRSAQLDVILGSLKMPGEKAKIVPTPTGGLDANFFKTFEDFLEQARTRCDIPGAAVAIVKDGKVVYAKGFGVCEKDKKVPVTTKTLFSIASMTKPLTTLLMARLVDAGKLTWDTPITQLIPGFQLADPKVTGELTMKYTVCACAGLPRQDADLVFPVGYTSPEDVIEKMRTMAPTTGFGETFQYSNIMVAAGGYAAARVVHPELPLGPAYAAVMKEYVFGPLGMKDTTLDFQSIAQSEHGSPHCYKLDYDYLPVPLTYNDWIGPVAPAAGAWSNVEDLSQYMLMELAKGIGPDGTRIVLEANLLKRREPQARISDKAAYGLGLVVEDDKGVSVVSHGGNSTGYTSNMFMLPAQNIGVVILTNAGQAGYFRGTVYERFMELVTGRESQAQDHLDRDISYRKSQADILTRAVSSQSAQSWFYNFTGDYVNEALGHVSLLVTQEGGMFDAGKWKAHITGYESLNRVDTYIYLVDPPLTWSEFILNDKEGHKTMTYKTPQKNYVFEQVPKSAGH